MSDDFLPKDYEVPQAESGYMKLEQGENRFRVLGSALLGVEVWTTEKKPLRFRPKEKFVQKENFASSPKHFWAFPVWNYKLERVQILEITQKTIQRAISTLSRNKKWGKPFDYDIVINRKGEGMDTEYEILPEPKEELDPEIKKHYEGLNINLEALYDGEDPFAEVEKKEEDIPQEIQDIPDFDA